MPTIPGAGPLILKAADKACEHLPNSTDREVMQTTAVVTAMAVDPLGTSLEIGRRVLR